jgi:hypothetical protein
VPAVAERGTDAGVPLGEGPDHAEQVGHGVLVGMSQLADGLVQR